MRGVLLSGFIAAFSHSFSFFQRAISHLFVFFYILSEGYFRFICILLHSLRSLYIFLKESVKGNYTKSYKILVTQDSYRVVSDFFWNSLESHVLPRAQRAAQDSCQISRHLIAIIKGVYILLKKGVKGVYTKYYKILVTQDSYRVVSDFFWIFLESHVLPRAQRAAQDS